jgi:hypothetical protein
MEIINWLKLELLDVSMSMEILKNTDYDNPIEKLKALSFLNGQRAAIEKTLKHLTK